MDFPAPVFSMAEPCCLGTYLGTELANGNLLPDSQINISYLGLPFQSRCGDLNSSNSLFPHSSGGLKFKIKVAAQGTFPEGSLLGSVVSSVDLPLQRHQSQWTKAHSCNLTSRWAPL